MARPTAPPGGRYVSTARSSVPRPPGAGWKRTGEKAGEYLSVLLDDPALPQPIRANLFRDDDAGSSWSLHWSRPRPREDRD